LEELESRLQDPGVFSTPDYPKLAKRQSELQEVVGLFDKLKKLTAQQKESEELAGGGDELAELARTELEDLNLRIEECKANIAEHLTPRDPNNERNAIFEARAAAGGDESSLFAAELYRMYIRYCETHGLKVELIGESPSEAGGFKEISFEVKGDGAYG